MENLTKTNAQPRDYTDLLLFLAGSPNVLSSPSTGTIILEAGRNHRKISTVDIAYLAEKGLIVRSGKQIMLSKCGYQLLSAGASRTDVAIIARMLGKESCVVAMNIAESPLGGLARRKAADGSNFLSQSQFDAGERIREDFTHAMIMPRISANWQSDVSSDQRGGNENGIEDVTNSIIVARAKFDAAFTALAGDLSGVVVDICCFLKGFEQVERERGWPKRSAKFMLKAGLTVLANHYFPQMPMTGRRERHWGVEGYRPTIS